MTDTEKAIKYAKSVIQANEQEPFRLEEIQDFYKIALQSLEEKVKRDKEKCFNCKYFSVNSGATSFSAGDKWCDHPAIDFYYEVQEVWLGMEENDFCSHFQSKDDKEENHNEQLD